MRSMEPKVAGAVGFVGPHGRRRTHGGGRSSAEHHCFERLQFGGEPGDVRTKFIVVLVRRLVAANDHQPFVIDSRSCFVFFLLRLLVAHQLLLLLVDS